MKKTFILDKVSYYIIGVTAFSALMLFLVVAMFIGPEPKLKNSQIVKEYAEALESLVVETEDENNQLAEELASADCQLALDRFDQIHSQTINLWVSIAASTTRVWVEEGLVDKQTVDLPESISKNFARAEELTDQREDIVKQKLADCINQ